MYRASNLMHKTRVSRKILPANLHDQGSRADLPHQAYVISCNCAFRLILR